MKHVKIMSVHDRSHTSAASADALRQLRKFVDRFAVTELQRLKENDPKKARNVGKTGEHIGVYTFISLYIYIYK